tara:strand:+ start:45 stop:563 length:519 start_codon:yes stop_codon:yes gene_type:complete
MQDGIIRGTNRKIIRVIPTLDTSAYGVGDVLFNSAAIPNAVLTEGGCSKLVAAYVHSSNTSNLEFEIIFTENAATFGTVNNTADISDGDLRTAGVLGYWGCESSDATTQFIDGSEIKRIYHNRSNGGSTEPQADPILLQSASNSTSVYFAVLSGGSITYAADDLQFIFHIEY